MANPALLEFGRDVQGYNTYAPQPSTVKWAATLVAGTASAILVPTTYKVWIVSFRFYPNDVWVDVSGAAAIVPIGDTLVPTTSELNPASLTLNGGTNISVITAQTTADISIVMWPVSYV
jgi:hypothetical protein